MQLEIFLENFKNRHQQDIKIIKIKNSDHARKKKNVRFKRTIKIRLNTFKRTFKRKNNFLS